MKLKALTLEEFNDILEGSSTCILARSGCGTSDFKVWVDGLGNLTMQYHPPSEGERVVSRHLGSNPEEALKVINKKIMET